jgi:L-phenylalanine/L-methionine N-acetyltransferase
VAEFVLRARRDDDLPAVAALLRRPGVVAGTTRLPFAPDEAARVWFAPDPNRHAIVADVGGVAVGHLTLHRGEGRRAHAATVALAVHDDHAGRGIGTALMAAACDLADRWLGLTRLALEVYADNAGAVRLYERFGFEREGVLRAASLRDGRLVDSLVMGRLVPAPTRLEAP